MFLNIRPLIHYRDFRLLFTGQVVSFLGSMISYVAIPYQLYQLTHSSLLVGLLGTVQLVPVLVFGLIGGSAADRIDRRRLMLVSECIMMMCALTLAANAALESPNIFLIFAATAVMQSASAFHRPAMDAMTQKLVGKSDYAAVAALGTFRYGFGAVLGPALGGVLIAWAGAKVAYLLDATTFLVALTTISLMKRMPAPEPSKVSGAKQIVDGLKFAVNRPELLGTYIVDIVAMTFAFPTALFPALGDQWGGATATGTLFSSMSVGSLLVTILSGWSSKVRRHGAWVLWAAAIWGAAIVAFGYAPSLLTAAICLAIAGAADTVSGIFRQTIWNETVPNEMRGRLAGIEMISYMSGPLLGNTRAGWMASLSSNRFSISSGGFLCVVGVTACAFFLPVFRRYRSQAHELPQAQNAAPT